jgi:esterase FrsA
MFSYFEKEVGMFLKDVLVTASALVGGTEKLTSRFGVGMFLPRLFKLRYSNMGGLDPGEFERQMSGLRSFRESTWCGYWNGFAADYEDRGRKCLEGGDVEKGVDSLIKAITYYTVSAFPGHTPKRMEAYWKARELFEETFHLLDDKMEKHVIEAGGEKVEGYIRLPSREGKYPMVIVTNGLEGTVQELAHPLLAYRDAPIGVYLMEMPGTYAYEKPMGPQSEEVYHGVIEALSRHPNVDPDRIAMVGTSFGGYWSARMAARSDRLACAVVSGAPLAYAFGLSNSWGTPEIFIEALLKVTGAGSLAELRRKLSELSFDRDPGLWRPGIPVLVLNGDDDTLLGTRDSILLATRAPRGFLKLYENDDHCAMGHYREWLDLTFEWLSLHLSPAGRTRDKSSAFPGT